MSRFRSFVIATVIGGVALLIGVRAASVPRSDERIDLRSFYFDFAKTEAEHALGLGGREGLAADAGMLFEFDRAGLYPFWMKGMRFPIDILWINEGVVRDIVTLQPPKNDKERPAIHIPLYMADRVLELPAGTASRMGIHPGVRLQLPESH